MRCFKKLAALLCLMLAPGVGVVGCADKTRDAGAPVADCNMHEGPCRRKTGDRTVTLDITPKPVMAMMNLEFSVTVSGDPPGAPPVIDLSMPGMVMGRNRVTLFPVAHNVFRGTGAIVRCPGGGRIWMATVILPAAGSARFVFDVAP